MKFEVFMTMEICTVVFRVLFIFYVNFNDSDNKSGVQVTIQAVKII